MTHYASKKGDQKRLKISTVNQQNIEQYKIYNNKTDEGQSTKYRTV